MMKIMLELNPESSMEEISTSTIPLVGIVILLVMLNVVIILKDFYSSFQVIFQILLNLLFSVWKIWHERKSVSAKIPMQKHCIDRNVDDEMLETKRKTKNTEDLTQNLLFCENVDDEKLSIEEVKMMMERLGTFCDSDGDELEEPFGSKEIDILFEEEPSQEEVKEAFALFDENNDGFIDARELWKVLCTLGFKEASEEDCKRMIRTFDDNGDGRIDFDEFVRLVENSFC